MTQPPVETPEPTPGRDGTPASEADDTGIASGGEFGSPVETPGDERTEGPHGDPVIDFGAVAQEDDGSAGTPQ